MINIKLTRGSSAFHGAIPPAEMIFLIFIFGIIIHIKFIMYFLGASLVVIGYGANSDLFTHGIASENIYIGLIYYATFMFGAMAGARGSTYCQSEYKEMIDNLHIAAGGMLLVAVMFFNVNALMASLIVASLYGASRKKTFPILFLILFLIFLEGVLDELKRDSYLPIVWVASYILGVIFFKGGISGLRFLITFPTFVVLAALSLYLGKYTANGLLVRLVEQVAPSIWGNASFSLASYFDVNGALSGAPLHRVVLMENGTWGPQFQVSYLFRRQGLALLPIYFLISFMFGMFLRWLLLSFNAYSAIRSVLSMYGLVYLSTGLLTEKPQLPTPIFIVLVGALIFETMIRAFFRKTKAAVG